MRAGGRGKHSRLNAQISEEAAEWFVEFRTGEPNAASREQFDAWVRSSPEHLRAYLEIAAIWNESNALDGSGALRIAEHIDALSNVVPLPSASESTPTRRTHRWQISAAAIVLLCLGLGVWYSLPRTPLYATEFGEQRLVRLADGSTVELNSRTQIQVHYSRSQRRIEMLSGQAIFQVAHNAASPFIVRNAAAEVKAIGTRFDVNLKQRRMIVTVIEGRVAVQHHEPKATALFVSAGEQITLTPRAVLKPARTNVAAVTAWTQHQVVLDSAPLSEVADEFNRYSARPLIIQDRAQPPLRLSGVFSTDPDFLLRYLRTRSDITIHETESEIQITRHE